MGALVGRPWFGTLGLGGGAEQAEEGRAGGTDLEPCDSGFLSSGSEALSISLPPSVPDPRARAALLPAPGSW